MAQMRDFIYVSERKLKAIGVGRARRRWSPNRIGIALGPLSGDVVPEEAATRSLHDAVARAERQVLRSPRTCSDPSGATVGGWLKMEAEPMVYGTYGRERGRAVDPSPSGLGTVALFLTGPARRPIVILHGSARHLLDRDVSHFDPDEGGSVPGGWRTVVGSLRREAVLRRLDGDHLDERRSVWTTSGLPWAVAEIGGRLNGAMAPQRVDLLARVSDIVDHDGAPAVVATPLYVAHARG